MRYYKSGFTCRTILIIPPNFVISETKKIKNPLGKKKCENIKIEGSFPKYMYPKCPNCVINKAFFSIAT